MIRVNNHHIMKRPNNPPPVPLNMNRFPFLVVLLQIHLITMHSTHGVAIPRVMRQNGPAHKGKRKIARTLPENFVPAAPSCKFVSLLTIVFSFTLATKFLRVFLYAALLYRATSYGAAPTPDISGIIGSVVTVTFSVHFTIPYSSGKKILYQHV